MTALGAIREGARRVNAAKRLWLIYYLATLLFAFTGALPFIAMLSRDLAGGLWADSMFRNFDPSWIAEFVYRSGGWPAVSVIPALLFLAGSFFLLMTFLGGGAVTVLASAEAPARHDSGLFWGGCGRNFGRLVRLALVSAVFYALVLALDSLLAAAGERAFREGMEERPEVIYRWIRTGFTLALLAFVNLVFDYARVRLVLEDSRRAVRAALGSFLFVFRNFRTTAGAFALALLLFVALAALGHGIITSIPATTAGVLLVIALVQQAFIVGRIWTKLLFYASEAQIYLARRPAPVVVTAEPQPQPEIAPEAAEVEPGEGPEAVAETVPVEETPGPVNASGNGSATPEPQPKAEGTQTV